VITPAKKCENYLAIHVKELEAMKEDLLKIGEMVGLVNLEEMNTSITSWNLDILADDVVSLCT